MNDEPTTYLFPIRELVQRTGVNASTLRAWESRHGLLMPSRTASGHRLYSQTDVRRIQRLRELLDNGLCLAEAGPLLDEINGAGPAAAALATADSGAGSASAWRDYLAHFLRAIEDFSAERLDAHYNEACALHPIEFVTENLLIPVLEELGERWERRPSGIAEEHFFSAWLRNKLGARLHHATATPRGRPLILACLPHENHEIGLLIVALAALRHGYRVVYLGANMPIRQILPVCKHTFAAGIVLAGRETTDADAILADIAWLAAATDTPVHVGSHFSVHARERIKQAGATPLGNHLALGIRALVSSIPPHTHR